MALDDQHFGSVPCIHFDEQGNGPVQAELAVRANCHPSPNYPDARIYIGMWGPGSEGCSFGGNGLTLPEAIKLLGMLKLAIAKVSQNAPYLLVKVEDYS